jgi:hypothetical protein
MWALSSSSREAPCLLARLLSASCSVPRVLIRAALSKFANLALPGLSPQLAVSLPAVSALQGPRATRILIRVRIVLRGRCRRQGRLSVWIALQALFLLHFGLHPASTVLQAPFRMFLAPLRAKIAHTGNLKPYKVVVSAPPASKAHTQAKRLLCMHVLSVPLVGTKAFGKPPAVRTVLQARTRIRLGLIRVNCAKLASTRPEFALLLVCYVRPEGRSRFQGKSSAPFVFTGNLRIPKAQPRVRIALRASTLRPRPRFSCARTARSAKCSLLRARQNAPYATKEPTKA